MYDNSVDGPAKFQSPITSYESSPSKPKGGSDPWLSPDKFPMDLNLSQTNLKAEQNKFFSSNILNHHKQEQKEA